MKQALLTILLLVLFRQAQAQGQRISPDEARRFITAVAADDSTARRFMLESEIRASERLGITYEGVQNKFLIGINLDAATRSGIASRTASGITIDTLGGDYSRIRLSSSQNSYSFYFKGTKAISPYSYFTRAWHSWKSKHFTFRVSDTASFNNYSAERLERFFDSMAVLLKFTAEDLRRIEEHKIDYILCRDEHEIEEVTGVKTLGIYILAYDYVVTTFNCHYHELLHLLVNYKLKSLPLYTHPLFQEGFAVGFGGRGGKEPKAILDAGHYLISSGLLDLGELYSRASFLRTDPTISYPVSGLFNRFLLEELGIDRYLQLYRSYSRPSYSIDTLTVDSSDLPPAKKWQAFLSQFRTYSDILVRSDSASRGVPLFRGTTIYEADSSYVFWINNAVALNSMNDMARHRSKKFSELVPDRPYHGEKYLVVASESEVSVYNLYTDNLIANYVGNFSLPPLNVPAKEGRFLFEVTKKVFDEALKE